MNRYALVVGITQYDYPYNFPSLTKPASDAEAVARLLEERGSFQKVTRLPECWNNERGCPQVASDRVSSEHLVQALQTFLEEADRGDAVIYFSGHGFVVTDKLNQRQNRKKGYLVTSDSQIETIATYGIPFDSLNNLLRDSNLNSLVLLLDCCHAGSYLERDLVEQTLTAFGSQKDYYLIAACRATEKAYEGEAEQANSVFTEALLAGLAQEWADRDGQISCDRLFDYIYKNRKLKNFGQQPIRLGLGGSITLVTYPIENREPVTLNRQNPYQGLKAFESEQSKYFYGREQAVRELLVRLNKDRFLSVIGPSGSGKSSLVKAGLLPQLRSNRISESSKWDIEAFTPGKHPLTPLQEIFARQHRRNQPYVLFIDQFEEVFTLCQHEEERRTFLQLITDEATNAERLARVIVALRGDFLDRCAAYPEPAILINSTKPRTYMVTPLSRAELEEAIEKPAALHGVTFERGLVSQILDDVDDQPGALPLLQYALSQLWRVCVENSSSEPPQLTKKGYEEIGGVKGALNETANNLYQTRSAEDQIFIRDLFVHLVQVEEDKVTRRPTSWERLEAIANSPEHAQRVVGLLADCRLLVTDEKNVQVAHEALLSEWKLLANWIEENRDNIRLSRRLEEACREWVEFKNSDEALLTGVLLTVIEEWKQRTNPKLPPLEAEYLNRSIEKRDRERQEKIEAAKREAEAEARAETEQAKAAEAEARAEAEKSKAAEAIALAEIEKSLAAKDKAEAEAKEAEARAKVQKQRTRFAMVAGVLLSFTLGLGLLVQKNEVKKKQVEAITVGVLISTSQKFLDRGNQLDALIASVQALDNLKKIDVDKSSALSVLESIIRGVRERNRLQVHSKPLMSVAFNPKGQTIASVGFDGSVKLWNIPDKKVETVAQLGKVLFKVKFSPDGNTLAVASQDKTIKLWNLKSNLTKPQLLKVLKAHQASVYDISFNPNGKTLASSGHDGALVLWDLETLQPIKSIREKERIVHIDFSTDQKTLAFTSRDKFQVKIWDTVNNTVKVVGSHGNPLSSVKFSSDGSILASSDYGGTIKLWNTSNYQLKEMFKTQHKGFLNSIALSSDNNLLTSAGEDGIIEVWNIKNKQPFLMEPIKGHPNEIQQIMFNPKNNQEIASASNDTTVKVWNLGQEEVEKTQQGQKQNLLVYSCKILESHLAFSETLNSSKDLEEIQNICNRNKH